MDGEDDGVTHNVRLPRRHFVAVEAGWMTFDLRRNDRDFQLHDTLQQLECDECEKRLTGRALFRQVTHILRGPDHGIAAGYCAMAPGNLPAGVSGTPRGGGESCSGIGTRWTLAGRPST